MRRREETKEQEKEKLAIVLAAKSRSLLYTSSPASPRVFASPIHTLASVPFCWEDKPGKPKNKNKNSNSSLYPKCLDLPPRLLLPGEFTQMPLPERKGNGRMFEFLRRKRGNDVVFKGSFVFLEENQINNSNNDKNMKIMKINRSDSVKGSHFWGSICNGLKQAMPWKNNKKVRSEKV